MVSEEWNKLSQEAKVPYFELAAKDKQRFIRENEAYKAANTNKTQQSTESGSIETEKESHLSHHLPSDGEFGDLIDISLPYKKVNSNFFLSFCRLSFISLSE